MCISDSLYGKYLSVIYTYIYRYVIAHYIPIGIWVAKSINAISIKCRDTINKPFYNIITIKFTEQIKLIFQLSMIKLYDAEITVHRVSQIIHRQQIFSFSNNAQTFQAIKTHCDGN